MRKFLCFFLLLFCTGTSLAQLTARIDPRFELTSIAFRLAGAREYAQCGVPEYARDIDNHFLPYAEHPLISFIQQIRHDYGIGYNAVSTSTDWLAMENGQVVLQPGYELSDIAKADPRWTEPVFRRYLTLLDSFYRDTGFQEFYDAHRALYLYAEGQLDTLLSGLDTEWFERFYGKPFGTPDVFIGLCNGPSNYALPERMRKSGYGIIVGCGCDQEGKPFYHPLFLTIVLHEFCHNYSNPLSEQYWPQMEQAADSIYVHVTDQMARLAYGNAHDMTGEWFNNLCMLMYYREVQPEWLDYLITNYQQNGFVWMRRATDLMDEFYANRERYPHIGDFMPRIAQCFRTAAEEFDTVQEEFRRSRPYVAEVTPASGSTVSADEALTRITVRFSEPMFAGMYGATWIERADVDKIPLEGGCYWQDEYTLVYPLKTTSLEKNKTYGLKLLGQAFNSRKRYPMAEDFEITFRVE